MTTLCLSWSLPFYVGLEDSEDSKRTPHDVAMDILLYVFPFVVIWPLSYPS